MAARKNGLAARCLTTGGMDSSFAGLGAARGWRRSGRFVAAACAAMLIVAAGVSLPRSENNRQELSSPTQSRLRLSLSPLQPLRRT